MWFNTAVKVVAVNLLAIILYTSQVASSTSPNIQHWYTTPTINNIFTGNRILSPESSGNFPNNNVDIIDVILPSDVKWLVATTLFTSNAQSSSAEEEPQFVATTQDGTAYLISANGTIDQIIDYTILDGSDVDQPPLVMTSFDEASNQQVTKIIQLPNTSNLSSLSSLLKSMDGGKPCTFLVSSFGGQCIG